MKATAKLDPESWRRRLLHHWPEAEQWGGMTVHNIGCRNRLVQVTAVLLLTLSARVHADRCAGGVDMTGNDCSSAPAVQGASATDSHLLYLKGAATTASLRLEQAKQRQSEANTAVKYGEADLKAALIALRDAEKASRQEETGLSSKPRR